MQPKIINQQQQTATIQIAIAAVAAAEAKEAKEAKAVTSK